jgi:peptidyl-prolyl cis-trans isomerase SurA
VFGKRRVITALLGAALVAGPLGAQGNPSEDSAANLDLPKDVQLLGPRDPNVRKATAIVNGAIITDTDIDQRLALVLAANTGTTISDEERARLRQQVLANLVDETLEIQEAAANKITVDKKDIDQAFARVAGQFKRSPKQFADYIHSQGSSEASLKRQIEGELAWRRVLGREVEPYVSVSDEEVNQVIDRMKAAKGSSEFHVAEIFLPSTVATQEQTVANADRIVDQLRKGASFTAYAREYSQSSSAAVGGDLGWVRAEQLPDELAKLVAEMPTGSVSNPVPIGGGYSIVALIDKRQVLTSDPRDATLALKQISITFPPHTAAEKAQPIVNQFAAGLKTLGGCGHVAEFAKSLNGQVVDNDAVKIRDLPPALQNLMLPMQVGEATPPFGSSEEGVRSLVICGRDNPAQATVPSFDEIQSQMSDERVNMRARRYLRDLRRDAVIDYR